MDHDAYRDLAVTRAAAHGRRYFIPGSTFRRCISAARVEPQTYSRALHQVERRTLTVQHAPARGAAVGRNDEPPSASADPWSFDTATIEQVSRRACLCPSCRGDGTVPCATCRGDAAVRCRACSGSGRVMGSRNRMKNCPTCRARGKVACTACSAGRVACRTCERTGRVEAWLTMQRAQLALVSASGSRAGMAVHACLDQPSDFDAAHSWPNDLAQDHAVDAAQLPAELAPAIDRRTDRVLATRVQTFASPVARVELATLFGRSHLELAGRDPAVGTARVVPLLLRLGLGAGVAVLGLFAALLTWGGYIGRHPWFAHEAQGGVLLTLLLTSAALASLGALGLALGRRGWSALGTWAPLAAAAIPAALGAGMFVAIVPSAQAAGTRLARGDVDGAAREADAARLFGSDRARAEAVLDEIHMQSVRAAQGVAALDAEVARPWFAAVRHDEAQELIRSALRADIETAFAAGNLLELRRIEGEVFALVPDAAPMLAQHVAALELAQCATRADWPCVAATWTRPRELGAPAAQWEPHRSSAIAALHESARTLLHAAPTAATAADRARILRDADHVAELLEALQADHPELQRPDLARRIAHADAEAARDAERAQREAAAHAQAEARRIAAETARAERAQRQAAAAASRRSAPAATPRFSSAPHCVRGCPCGRSCIPCSHQCRH